MPTVDLPAGTMHYEESGDGPHAKRLVGILPDARLELILGSRTWVMRGQPQRTVHRIRRFARSIAAAQTTRTHQTTSADPVALKAANKNG